MTSAVSVAAAPSRREEPLSDQTFAALRDHILPRPEELRWQEIPWRTTFWEAVQEAQAAEKPILLWAMNGHPLALT